MKKIWYFIILAFFSYTIVILNRERNSIGYHIKETEEIFFNFSVCFKLSDFYKSETEVKIDQILEDFKKYFKRSQTDSSISPHRSNNAELEKISSNSENCFIFKDRFCLIIKEQKDLRIQLKTRYFAFNRGAFQLFPLKRLDYGSIQIIVRHLDYKCSQSPKFMCLNECNKRHKKLSSYYYDFKESGLIFISENATLKFRKSCSKKCSDVKNCYLSYFSAFKDNRHKTAIFEPYMILDDFHYYIQFAGLICLFLSISLIPLSSKFFKFINFDSMIKNLISANARKNLLFFRLPIAICFLFLILFIYSIMFLEYLEKRDNSDAFVKGVIINNFNLELSLVICIPHLINFYGKTLSELEQITSSKLVSDQFLIQDAYLDFLNKKIKIHPINFNPKVIFTVEAKGNSKIDRPTYLMRCFQADFHLSPYQPKYQRMFAIAKLIIKLPLARYSLYVLSEGENLNNHSSKINFVSFSKNELIRSRLNKKNRCVNHKEAYNCSNSLNCIDICISKQFYKEYKNVSIYSIIDKDHFTPDQYKDAYLNDSKEIFEEIKRKCSMNYLELDCNKINFEEVVERHDSEEKCLISLDLYYEVKTLKEDDHPLSNYIFCILNIQSILFALSPVKLLFISLNYLKAKFKLKSTKFYSLLIYILCFCGFTYHSYFIFDNLVDTETINSQFYESQEKIKIPELIFCTNFQYRKDKFIDLNHKLTYSYLNDLSYDLNANKIFERIEYFDGESKWIEVNNETNFENDDLKILTFFFLSEKCFKLTLEVDYYLDLFQFRKDNDVVKVYFNRTFIHQLENFYFLTKFDDEMHFSKMIELWLFEAEYFASRKYFVRQEFTRNDKYLTKNPFSLFDDETTDRYLKDLINNFKNDYNYVTLNLPLDESSISKGKFLEVNDELFEEYFKHFQNITDHPSSSDLNTQNNYATNYLYFDISFDSNIPDFTYILTFYRKVIISSNKVNVAKLILNLINLKSLWLGIGVLDLHAYLIYIKKIFIYKIHLLIKLERLLIELL